MPAMSSEDCGFDSRLGHFATSFSKEFNLTMLTAAEIAPP